VVSAGRGSYINLAGGRITFKTLIEQGDIALYESKRGGRNSVRLANCASTRQTVAAAAAL
jgi:GGDEF domain-containing protein